jgi:hypothetical protein
MVAINYGVPRKSEEKGVEIRLIRFLDQWEKEII